MNEFLNQAEAEMMSAGQATGYSKQKYGETLTRLLQVRELLGCRKEKLTKILNLYHRSLDK